MSNYDECDAEASKLLYLYLNGGEPGGVSIHKRIAALLRAERSKPKEEWVSMSDALKPPPPPQWVFVPTGEKRQPEKGEWWLCESNGNLYEAAGIESGSHPIYRRVSVEELKCPGTESDLDRLWNKGWNACLLKLGIKP